MNDAAGDGIVSSNRYNIELPGDTCGLDPAKSDLVEIGADQLNVGAFEAQP